MFGIVADEARKMARNPRRLVELFRPRRWRQFFGVLFFNARAGNRWSATPGSAALKQRQYSSYDQYVRHQQSKFANLDLTEYDRKYRELLRARLKEHLVLKRGTNVLCLGARQGTEVKAFLDLGCFAVGLDLNPGKENKFVVHGDFHAIQFADESVEVAFTNSFDHVFDPEKFIKEIRRVLKPGGWLIVEAISGEAEQVAPDHYASFWWQRVDDLVAMLGKYGFAVTHDHSFAEPWPGRQLCFVKMPPKP